MPRAARYLLRKGGDLTFLLRDDFINADSAPVTSPRTCEPGPGTLTFTDTENKCSVSGGALVINGGKSSPEWGDPGLWGAALTREAGLATAFKVSVAAAGGDYLTAGFDNNQSGIGQDQTYLGTTNQLIAYNAAASLSAATYADDTEYQTVVIARETGAFHFVKGGVFTDWTLLYVDGRNSTASIYPAIACYNHVATIDTIRVARLPGEAGDAVAGNGYEVFAPRDLDVMHYDATPTHNDSGTATPDVLVGLTIPTVPTNPDAIDLALRYVDNDNYLKLRVNWSGPRYEMFQFVDGNYSGLGSHTPATNGDDVILKLCGNDCYLYLNGDTTPVISNVGTVSSELTGSGWLFNDDGSVGPTDLTIYTLDGVANVDSANYPGPGLATTVMPGPVGNLETYTHEADFILRCLIVRLPNSYLGFKFRMDGEGNFWSAEIEGNGRVILWYYDGSWNNRAAGAVGNFSNGDYITIRAEGSNIKIFNMTGAVINYSSATELATETDGEIRTLGSAPPAQISNLVTWPLHAAAGANKALNAMFR